ncbi:hypothetical protein BH20ACT24_BH20ACT24_00960 [soil metagenome]
MDDAKYYQDHKDDPSEWGDAEPPERAGKRRLASMLSVRLAPEEEESVRREARKRQLSVSSFIRSAVLAECRPSAGLLPVAAVRVAPAGALPIGTVIALPEQVTWTQERESATVAG